MSKIVSLTAENIKRLRAVTIEPDGNLVVVGGKNGHGKTSTLDAIWMAMGGAAAMPERPVRDGEASGSITVELDSGIVVHRRINADRTTRLEVTNKDGARYKSPQALLDGLVGSLAFNPLRFAQMPPRERVAVLKNLVGLDTTEIDERRRTHAEARANAAQSAKRLESRLAALPHHADAPDREVSVDDMNAALAEIARQQDEAASQRRRIAEAKRQQQQLLDAMKRRDEEIAALRAQQEIDNGKVLELDRKIPLAEQRLADNPPPDAEAARLKLAEAQEVNRKVRENAEYARVRVEHDNARFAAEIGAEAVAQLDREKREALAAARYPIEGLAFDDAAVTYNGIPFDQLSGAEKLRISIAMGMALNPELRVLLVPDASLLDEDSLAMVAAMAEANDAQVWLERVGKGDEVTVIIEDGAVLQAVRA